MNKQDLIQEFINISTKFRRIIHHNSSVSLEEKFATILQMQALSYLKENSDMPVGDLAKKLQMSSPAIAQFTDRLVNSGWIKRDNDSKDRRITLLSLTPEGEKQLKETKDKHFQKMSEVLSLLEEKDLKDMTRIMTTLVERVENKK